MGHVIPKQLRLLKDVEKQVVLFICGKMLLFINKRKGGTKWPLYCCSSWQNFSLFTKSSTHNLQFLFFYIVP